MGISFSNLVENERTVAIDINGNDLHVTYRPSKLSPAFMTKIGEDIEDDDELAFARLFCSIVADWDLEGPIGEDEFVVEHGQKVPLEAEYVSWVPAAILRYIIEQIGEDSAPKSKKKARR